MNKLRHFVVLLLALVAGFGTVRAQYEVGEAVTSITPGEDVCLYSPCNAYALGQFLCGTDWSSAVTSDCIYHFVATGNTVDGHPTYYLQQVSTGLYLGDAVIGSEEDTSLAPFDGKMIYYTSDLDEAYEFTALPSAADSGDPRTTVNTDNYVAGTFVLARAEYQTTGLMSYLGTYSSPFMSIYTDTNQWAIATVSKLPAGDYLLQRVNLLMPNGMSYFKQGTTPGCVAESAYTQLEAAYNAAMQLGVESDVSEEACDAAYDALAAAVEAANNAIITVEVGKYYYFISQRSTDGMYASGSNLLWTSGFTTPTDPTNLNSANYMWQIEDAGDGTYYLKNYATGTYVGTNNSGVSLTAQPQQAYALSYSTSNETNVGGVFNVMPVGNNTGLHTQVDGYKVVWWSDLGAPGDCWEVRPVDEDFLNSIADAVEQNRRNSELSELYATARASYMGGRYYSSAATPDYFFDDLGIVTDAAQLSTNAQCSSEGPIEGLLDNDFTTYFHSEWSSSAPAENHYIQINLGEDLQTFVLKYAERLGQHAKSRPATVRVLYTNTPEDEDSWADAGTVEFTYPYSLTQSDGTTVGEAVGLTAVELPAAARYVRLVVLSTTNNQLINGYPFFYLSELHVYEGTYDPANSPYEQVEQSVRTAFETQLTAAEAALAAGTATQEGIDALQSAYDALMAQLPVPTRLTQAIADARAAVEDLPIGEDLGTFPQSAYDAFTAAIAEVEATVNSNMTLTAINEGLAKVATALSTYLNSLVLPEEGKVYTLRGMTADANNTRALNAVIYSNGNSETAALQSMAQQDGLDPVTPTDNLNYLWKVEAVGDGHIALRNLGTGYYFGTADELNANVPNVKEYTELPIRSAGVAGGFNLTVGDGLYANFAGQRTPIVAWNTASGADNSAIRFEEVNMNNYANQSYWTVTPAIYQVLCLPYEVYNFFDPESEGTAYTVLGQREDNGNYTLELRELTDEVIPAGMPFVFKAAAGVSQVVAAPTYEYFDGTFDMTYAAEAQTTDNGALTGTLSEHELTESENAVAVLRGGALSLITAETTEASDRTVTNNSGYFNAVTTTETGAVSLSLPDGGIVSGIGQTLVDADAPVDVYTLSGVLVRKNVNAAKATQGLPAGLYIVGGQKVLVK